MPDNENDLFATVNKIKFNNFSSNLQQNNDKRCIIYTKKDSEKIILEANKMGKVIKSTLMCIIEHLITKSPIFIKICQNAGEKVINREAREIAVDSKINDKINGLYKATSFYYH